MKKKIFVLILSVALILSFSLSATAEESLISYRRTDTIPQGDFYVAIGKYNGQAIDTSQNICYIYRAYTNAVGLIQSSIHGLDNNVGFESKYCGIELRYYDTNKYYIVDNKRYVSIYFPFGADPYLKRKIDPAECCVWNFEKQSDGTYCISQHTDKGVYYIVQDKGGRRLYIEKSESFKKDVISNFDIYIKTVPHEHNYNILLGIDTPATCTSDAIGIYKCEYCDETIKKPIPDTKLLHNFSVFVAIDTPATCTSDAIGIYKCEYCYETIKKPIPDTKLSHNFSVFVGIDTPATCTSDAIGIYKCEYCDETIKKPIPDTKLSHNFSVFVGIDTPATCTSDAIGIYKCEYCDDIIKKPIPDTKLSHNFSILVGIDTPATCTSDAIGIYKCEFCNETIKKSIPGTKLFTQNISVTEDNKAPLSDDKDKIPSLSNPQTSFQSDNIIISVCVIFCICSVIFSLICFRKSKSVV